MSDLTIARIEKMLADWNDSKFEGFNEMGWHAPDLAQLVLELAAELNEYRIAGVEAFDRGYTVLQVPNVVRASRGTVFAVPVVQISNQRALDWLRKSNIKVMAATPSATKVFSDLDLRGSTAIAVGTEDEGLSDFWLSHADEKVLIPMKGKVNSLNVAASVAIIAYEVVRQRSSR